MTRPLHAGDREVGVSTAFGVDVLQPYPTVCPRLARPPPWRPTSVRRARCAACRSKCPGVRPRGDTRSRRATATLARRPLPEDAPAAQLVETLLGEDCAHQRHSLGHERRRRGIRRQSASAAAYLEPSTSAAVMAGSRRRSVSGPHPRDLPGSSGDERLESPPDGQVGMISF